MYAAILLATIGVSSFSWAQTPVVPLEPPVLRLSMEAEPLTLDWHGFRSPVDRFILSFIMRGLLKYDGTSKAVCDLCRKLTLSPDGRTYRFELNDETQWSDGVRLEAGQFVDSFRRLLDPAHHFKAADEFLVIEGAQQSGKKWDAKKLAVKAETRDILEITLKKPLGYFPDLLTTIAAFPIRKEFINGPSSATGMGENHAREAVLGPYILAEWQHGKRIVIEGNPKSTERRPVYRVEFIVGPRGVQVDRFKSGKIDILSSPTTEDLVKLGSQKIQVNAFWATRNLIFNFQKKVTSDIAFRRAVLYGLDREALPPFLKNGERRVTGLIPPGLGGYRDLLLATADPTRAQSERHRAVAWPKIVEVDLLVRNTGTEKQVAQWLADQLEKIKIKVVVHSKPDAVYYSELEKGHFDMALTAANFDIANPTHYFRGYLTGAAENRGRWAHLAYDTLVEQMTAESDPIELAKKVDQATQLIEVQEVSVIPLGYPTQPFLLGPRVQRFTVTPFGDPDLVNIELKH